MSETITTQLVGSHFRPPAKALLACLPASHPLFLRPEPTNEYDKNAVQVVLRTASLLLLLSDPFFSDNMESELANQGFGMDSIKDEEEWHLGYLPRAAKGNAKLEEWNMQVQQAVHEVCATADFPDPPVVACTLSFDSSGKPTVIIPWPPCPEGAHPST